MSSIQALGEIFPVRGLDSLGGMMYNDRKWHYKRELSHL